MVKFLGRENAKFSLSCFILKVISSRLTSYFLSLSFSGRFDYLDFVHLSPVYFGLCAHCCALRMFIWCALQICAKLSE